MIMSKRELLRVYEANADDADGKLSIMNEDRAGI
jgi:hypothetical protein